jgi:hypothetical protein
MDNLVWGHCIEISIPLFVPAVSNSSIGRAVAFGGTVTAGWQGEYGSLITMRSALPIALASFFHGTKSLSAEACTNGPPAQSLRQHVHLS